MNSTDHKYVSSEPLVAHYNSSYLPLTEVWIYNQLIHMHGIRSLFLSRTRQNLDLFPSIPLCSLNELPLPWRIMQLLFSKVFGYIPRFSRCAREASLLHVHFGYNGVKLRGLKKHLHIPMICSFYGIDAFSYPLQSNFNLKKLRRLFRDADRILVLGPYMRDTLVDMGCPAQKIFIQHLGVDLDKIKFARRTRKSSEPVRFLLASSFIEKKGVDICLKALVSLKEEFLFNVDVIGDGPLKGQLYQIVEEGGIGDRVTFHGYQPYHYFIDLAYHCDIFLQASKTSSTNDKEGTPMSIVDAMATGLPVVSTRHSDIPEIVNDGVTGFLAEENDVKLFRQAIQKMFERIDELSAFSENSRLRIEEHFNIEKQASRLKEIYLEMMKNKDGDH